MLAGALIIVALSAALIFALGRRAFRFYAQIRYQSALVAKIPGPRALPIFGCLHDLPSDAKKQEAWLLAEAAKVQNAGCGLLKLW